MEPSYASGTSSTPLLGDTIGDNLDRTIARFGDREALVSVHQDLRYTYAQFGEAVDRAARAFIAAGIEPGDRVGHLEPELRRVGARAVRDGQGRDHPGQHQPGLPDVGARVRAAPVAAAGCWSPRPRSRPPTTCRWSTTCATTSSALEQVVFIGRDWEEFIAGGERVSRRASCARARPRPQFDDPINIQYTSGTTGFPKGATLSHHNILNNGYFVGARLPLHRGGPGLHPGALLPLLRHGHGQPRRAPRTAPAW